MKNYQKINPSLTSCVRGPSRRYQSKILCSDKPSLILLFSQLQLWELFLQLLSQCYRYTQFLIGRVSFPDWIKMNGPVYSNIQHPLKKKILL